MVSKKINEVFYVKIDTNLDVVGDASGFTCEIIKESDGTSVVNVNPFVEIDDGLYHSEISLGETGQYVIVVKNDDHGVRKTTSVVITETNIDELNTRRRYKGFV